MECSLKLLCFFLGCSFVFCQSPIQSSEQLLCYDCDPLNSAGDCHQPNKSGASEAPVKACNSTSETCLSAFIEIRSNNNSGVYRGCFQLKPDVQDFCDWFREEKNNETVTVKSCHPCNTTRCNSIVLYADGKSQAVTIQYNHVIISSIVILFTTYVSLGI